MKYFLTTIAILSGIYLYAQDADSFMLETRRGICDNDFIINPVTDFDCADPSVVLIDD